MKELKDKHLYNPLFNPWHDPNGFLESYKAIQKNTLVSPDRCYTLVTLASQAMNIDGNIWECGVYKGGTAKLLADTLANNKKLMLFDTFEGMPECDLTKDFHNKGDFNDASLEAVKDFVGTKDVEYIKGFIPDTFKGIEDSKIAFAHIDVDIYKSIIGCCEFIYPRLSSSGFMVFDDYGFPSCPGAREAVDYFFADKPENPLVLPTGQALIIKI